TARRKLQDEDSSTERSRTRQYNAEGVRASLPKAACPSIRKHNENELSRTLSRIGRPHEKSAPAPRQRARGYLPSLSARCVPVLRSPSMVLSRRAKPWPPRLA